ncbi:MAG: hypothetical protein N2606_06140 [Candidatus Omnitrophica bacterium]|nr:hypothetical protein [Candidatus Omnitrophota bacterium]
MYIGKKRLFLVFFILMLVGGTVFIYFLWKNKAKQNQIIVKAIVNKNVLNIGDNFRYEVQVEGPKDMQVEIEYLTAEALGVSAIKDFGLNKKTFLGRSYWRQWYILDTYVSGNLTINSPSIRFRREAQSDWQTLKANNVTITVKSVLENSLQKETLRDIRGPKDITEKSPILILGVVLLILAVCFLLYFLKGKKKQKKPPVIPADVIALRALEELQNKQYVEKGLYKLFYFELSDIVRRYLENRFGIRAPEMTTEEFLHKLNSDQTSLEDKHKQLLGNFLGHCDLVKFAKYQPDKEEINSSLDSARMLIEETGAKNIEQK